MFRHIVLFRVYDEVSDDRIDTAITRLASLATLPGVVSMRVERSLDTRKGRMLIEDAMFEDARAFSAFRAHPAHVAVAAEMAEISDWWVGDYAES
ncbi:Dabb family protein [Microbacterium sp. NPDC064584]|uniref:Dabb family protein n=1 Tax=Microbacterium sp. NPDC064584 TaxID=3155817 RepID=UPI0034449DD4